MLIHVYKCHGNIAKFNVFKKPATLILLVLIFFWISWNIRHRGTNGNSAQKVGLGSAYIGWENVSLLAYESVLLLAQQI